MIRMGSTDITRMKEPTKGNREWKLESKMKEKRIPE